MEQDHDVEPDHHPLDIRVVTELRGMACYGRMEWRWAAPSLNILLRPCVGRLFDVLVILVQSGFQKENCGDPACDVGDLTGFLGG